MTGVTRTVPPARARVLRLAAVVLASAAVAAGMWAWAAGGLAIKWFGIRLSLRGAPRLFAFGGFLLGVLLCFPATRHDDLTTPLIERLARLLVVFVAVTTIAVGICWGAAFAGGSDSSGYLSEARMFADAALTWSEPLAATAPWADGARSFAPLGHRPGAAGEMVPTYPPGYPLLMAPFFALGVPAGAFWVTPVMGAVAVLATFVIGRRLSGPLAGLTAAALLAASPAFLYQLVQPMTDVPATALWAAALATPSAPAAGLLAGLALLVRPNLAPLVVLAAGALLARRSDVVTHAGRARLVCTFGLGILPSLLILAWLNLQWYGRPLASGHGSFEEFFSAANILPNLRAYSRWMTEVHTPLIWLAPLGLLAAARRAEAVALLLFALGVVALYLPYGVFDHWSYTRFLLPALPVLFVGGGMALSRLGRLVGQRDVVCLIGVALIAPLWIAEASHRSVFRLQAWERRYEAFARMVARATPPDAVVVTLQHSGSVHFYTGRTILRWDVVAPAELDGALEWLRARGRPPFIAVESEEIEAYRTRLAGVSRYGRLDWAPVDAVMDVQLYDPSQRRSERGSVPADWVGSARAPTGRADLSGPLSSKDAVRRADLSGPPFIECHDSTWRTDHQRGAHEPAGADRSVCRIDRRGPGGGSGRRAACRALCGAHRRRPDAELR